MIPPLHVVVTDDPASRPGFERTAVRLLEAAGPALALHLRLRKADARHLYRFAESLGAIAAATGGWCVINDRVDVALAAEAQAVQLGAGSLPVGEARRLLPKTVAVGASVHTPEAAVARAAEGADYLVVGTVFRTATHPGHGAGGPQLVRSCALAGVPVVGIGGIGRRNAPDVLAAGGTGVAVVRAVWDAEDPVGAATDLLGVLGGGGTDA